VTLRIDDGAAVLRAVQGYDTSHLCKKTEYRMMDGAVALDRLLKSKAVVADEADAEFVEALAGLNDRDNDFRERCVHAVALMEVKQLTAAIGVKKGAKKAVRAHVAVWARRALFGLSAHPSVQTVIDAVTPAGKRYPCREPLAEDATFTRSEPPLSAFTIKALLRDAESAGIAVSSKFEKSCDALLADGVTLRPYQLQNVFWALHQEDRSSHAKTSVPGLNGYYWERRSFPDGDDFYYFPHGGHVLLEPPPVVSGGLLADEMGYGKTITALALIAADLEKNPLKNEAGTLVVVPRSLYGQWAEEIKTKAPRLKCVSVNTKERKLTSAEALGTDVVLLRQDQLNDFNLKVPWRRIVVDECQFVANDVGVLARAASRLDATHVWMLSGTPITTKIEDLQGEMSLLRIWPFTLGKGADAGWQNHFWEANCKTPWGQRDHSCLATFKALVKGTMMRHSREQRTAADDEPLVPLPPLSTRWVGVDAPANAPETYVTKRLELFAAQVPNHQLVRCLQKAATFAGADAVLESLHKACYDGTKTGGRAAAAAPRHLAENAEKIATSIVKELSLAEAVAALERDPSGTNAVPALQEFKDAQEGRAPLLPCEVCKRAKRAPVVLPCRHSFCLACVRHLAKDGAIKCGVCVGACQPGDCFKLKLPEDAAPPPAPMDEDSGNVGSATLTLRSTKLAHTLADLDAWPAPTAEPARDKRHPDLEAFGALPRTLRCQHEAAKKQGWRGSAKLTAVNREIKRLREADVTAQFVVVSQYGDLLDELQESFDPTKYEIEIDLANREGKKLVEGTKCDFREAAYGAAVEARVVEVDEKKECKACGMTFECPFPEVCPRCYVECQVCPNGADQCGWTCKPCDGVVTKGIPCTRDENCPKCKGKFGCGHVYGPTTEPAADADGKLRCTNPACTALRPVKEKKKVVQRRNDTPLIACSGCSGKYGCGAKFTRLTCPPADAEGKQPCPHARCRALRSVSYNRGKKIEQKPNDRQLFKYTLRSLTKKVCSDKDCKRDHFAPLPEDDRCVACQSQLKDTTAGLPKYLYTIETKGYGGETRRRANVLRSQLTPKRHTCVVPGKMLRAEKCPDQKEGCLTRGGFDNRFRVGDVVTAQRPPLELTEPLEVGMRIQVQSGAYAGGSGTVFKLLAADRYEVKVRPPRGGAEIKEEFDRKDLKDVKDGTWRAGRVVRVVSPNSGANPFSPAAADPFADTLGSIRLDASSPDRRGLLLETFRSDPETAVLLLTLETAGVGLNITNANKVMILEPFRFGATEAQAVTRVHRIGQTRPVEIIKFFTRGTVDERVLRLRQKKGELDASGDADAPSADDVGQGAGDTQFSPADLDLLFGVTE